MIKASLSILSPFTNKNQQTIKGVNKKNESKEQVMHRMSSSAAQQSSGPEPTSSQRGSPKPPPEVRNFSQRSPLSPELCEDKLTISPRHPNITVVRSVASPQRASSPSLTNQGACQDGGSGATSSESHRKQFRSSPDTDAMERAQDMIITEEMLPSEGTSRSHIENEAVKRENMQIYAVVKALSKQDRLKPSSQFSIDSYARNSGELITPYFRVGQIRQEDSMHTIGHLLPQNVQSGSSSPAENQLGTELQYLNWEQLANSCNVTKTQNFQETIEEQKQLSQGHKSVNLEYNHQQDQGMMEHRHLLKNVVKLQLNKCGPPRPLSPQSKAMDQIDSNSQVAGMMFDLRNAVACSSRSLDKPACRALINLQHGSEDHPNTGSANHLRQKTGSINPPDSSKQPYSGNYDLSRLNKRQNGIDFLNLQKCSPHSLGSGSACSEGDEEQKDLVGGVLPKNEDNQTPSGIQNTLVNRRIARVYPHSSQEILAFSEQGQNHCYRNHIFENDSEIKSPFTSPGRGHQVAKSHNGDAQSWLEGGRRNPSVGKRAVLDLGRSPRVPFVQNLRTALKRNSSQRIIMRHRNLSPGDQAAEYNGEYSETGPRRLSLGKSDSNKKRRQFFRDGGELSSAEKHSASIRENSIEKAESQMNTPLHPEDIFRKYESYPDKSLKKSVYKDVSMQIIQAINIIQQIPQFATISEASKIPFEFKKKGFNKLLIFDLDETLIHSMRDDDEQEFPELADVYEENEPDMFVNMEAPGSDYGPFKQAVFKRPYLIECLRAANIDYEVAVFTAGYDWYANPIINMIDPTGTLIQHRFFRQHAQTVEYQGQESLYKDLDVFSGIDLTRTLIVDNQVFSFASHLSNGVPIASFYGCKKDSELIKVMRYVHQIASEENLQVANEMQFGLKAMLDIPLNQFVKYYRIDEMSESDENDFNDDGRTLKSNQAAGFPIFSRNVNENGESFRLAGDETDEVASMHFNQSIQNCDHEYDRNSTYSSVIQPDQQRCLASHLNMQMQRGLNSLGMQRPVSIDRFLIISEQMESHVRADNSRNEDVPSIRGPLKFGRANEGVPRLGMNNAAIVLSRHQSMHNQIGSHLVALSGDNQAQDDPYTRISKKDEGNIGGTLSNAHQSSNNEARANSPGHTENGSTIMQFGEAIRQDIETDTALRVPVINLSGVTDTEEEKTIPASSPQINQNKAHMKRQKTCLEAVSSYHKVCLTTEKARRRQNSIGQRKHDKAMLGRAYDANHKLSFASESKQLRQVSGTASSMSGQIRYQNSNASATGINSQYLTRQIGSQQQLQNQHIGSDSYRKITREGSDSRDPPITFAGLVEMEQKTLTSVKKTAKVGVNSSIAVSQNQQSVTRSDTKPLVNQLRSPEAAPSEAFMSQAIRKVNNTLKPPNWTKRKQNILRRLNTQVSPGMASPAMASNISHHLDRLAQCYKESGKKSRQGAEPSLMQQLLEANENNAKFLTPSSSSQITPSLLSSTKKKFVRSHQHKLLLAANSMRCNSTDKWQQLKNSVNRQSLLPGSLHQADGNMLDQNQNLPIFTTTCDSPDKVSSSQRSNSSPTIFKMKTKRVESAEGLPPRPTQQVKTASLQSGGGGMGSVIMQHSMPERELQTELVLIEEDSVLTSKVGSGKGAQIKECKSGSAQNAGHLTGSSLLSCSESEQQAEQQVIRGGK